VDAPAQRGERMTQIEWLAAALVLINVALVALRSVWNYPFALVAVSLYAVVFYDARLYSDMVLQGFFFALNLYGWASWLRARNESGVPVGWMDQRARQQWALVTIAAWAAWSFAMDRYTNAVAPWIDGAIAMLSITAQWLLARRRVESWYLWIVVDLIAIPLFAWRGLYATSAVYVVLLGLSIDGLIQWRRAAVTGRVAI
jgi:nicotinamide mononucleotide transporter